MTTRRGLFGWIAGALALGAGVKVAAEPTVQVATITADGAPIGIVEIDALLKSTWDHYAIPFPDHPNCRFVLLTDLESSDAERTRRREIEG